MSRSRHNPAAARQTPQAGDTASRPDDPHPSLVDQLRDAARRRGYHLHVYVILPRHRYDTLTTIFACHSGWRKPRLAQLCDGPVLRLTADLGARGDAFLRQFIESLAASADETLSANPTAHG